MQVRRASVGGGRHGAGVLLLLVEESSCSASRRGRRGLRVRRRARRVARVLDRWREVSGWWEAPFDRVDWLVFRLGLAGGRGAGAVWWKLTWTGARSAGFWLGSWVDGRVRPTLRGVLASAHTERLLLRPRGSHPRGARRGGGRYGDTVDRPHGPGRVVRAPALLSAAGEGGIPAMVGTEITVELRKCTGKSGGRRGAWARRPARREHGRLQVLMPSHIPHNVEDQLAARSRWTPRLPQPAKPHPPLLQAVHHPMKS